MLLERNFEVVPLEGSVGPKREAFGATWDFGISKKTRGKS